MSTRPKIAPKVLAGAVGASLTLALVTVPLVTPAQAAPDPFSCADAATQTSTAGKSAAWRADLAARASGRASVTNESFYFVMADRFANGDTANDTGGLGSDPLVSGFDQTKKGFYQGGDLAGLCSKLDYIQGLGTTSIWLTPSFKNKAVQLEDGPSAGYHGYWVTDFTQIDPHLGTNAELGSLIDAAHARGMKVYFDIITNHTADVIGYEGGARTAYAPKDKVPYKTADGKVFDDRDYAGKSTFPALDPETSFPYKPVLEPGEENLKVPAWLNDTTLYHNRGNTTFTGEDSLYGDFFGLDDLMTEHPTVVNGMIDVYEKWIGDFGVDGFRIDTMKHVNDQFWQKFGPAVLKYAKDHGKNEFFMFGEVYDTTKPFTSQFTTRDKMQAVLDFPFQDAARNFASKSQPTSQLGTFFRDDDWYTDADSNVYQLPTFLGNHDMGRIGSFIKADNSGADETELVARDRLAHELMYFSRGNPVIYYGDEQGFTGNGGDQDARQTMFATGIADYLDDDLLGTASTHAQDNFDQGHPLYAKFSQLASLTKQYPALRNGAHQDRYSTGSAGIYAFSRMLRNEQIEYVVALNNSEEAKTAAIPTYVANGAFSKVYGGGTSSLTTDASRNLTVSVPALSTVVYKSVKRVPAAAAAPSINLGQPRVSPASNSRMLVQASVGGSSFNEVTFYAKAQGGEWKQIGTDDTRPYRVFHDVSGYRARTPIAYRAVVRDNAGHTRQSDRESARVPKPKLTWVSPAANADVFGEVKVEVAPDPEKPSQRVVFERRVGNGAWQVVKDDWSSPAYVYYDDVNSVPVGTTIRYRATLVDRDGTSVRSDVRTVTRELPVPLVNSVTVAGSLQSEIGCPGDWQENCATSHLTFDTADGLWKGTWTIPAGSYEWKVAINDSWTVNYGAGGAAGGSNLTLELDQPSSVTFVWDQVSKVPSATVN